MCFRVSPLWRFCSGPCILPAALKTRSTPADEIGAARICLAILERLGNRHSCVCHQWSWLKPSTRLSWGRLRYSSSSSSNASSAGWPDTSGAWACALRCPLDNNFTWLVHVLTFVRVVVASWCALDTCTTFRLHRAGLLLALRFLLPHAANSILKPKGSEENVTASTN